MIMSSIVLAVFRVTIGLLVDKGRDEVAKTLKDGDVTDQKFRGLIIREIDDIKSKLDGLSRKDLGASISFFEEGIELLYEVFGKARPRSEHGANTTQACYEAFSFAKGMRKLELTDLDEAAARKLYNSKDRFKQARIEATRAFKNEALETADRILAMQYRVMATILETVDNPEDAVAPCRVCLKELNSLSAVQSSFNVQLKKGIQAVKGLFGKDKRGKIISSVCHVNRVIYDVTLTVGRDVSFWTWPTVDIDEDKVDPLRDESVADVLRRESIEHCYVPWSFGQESEEEHKLKNPRGIATNSSGQFIVADHGNVKVFDSSGKFMAPFSLPTDDLKTYMTYSVFDATTDMNDNLYVLVRWMKWYAVIGNFEYDNFMYKFTYTGDLQHKFPLREGGWFRKRMAVTDSDKVLVLRESSLENFDYVVDVYKTDGQFVDSFGEGMEDPCDITAANDGRVMVVEWNASCLHIFSEDGNHLNKIKLQGCYSPPSIAFHSASEHVVVAGVERKKDLLQVEIYTKDGEFVRSIQIHEEKIGDVQGMAVSSTGRIAMILNQRNRSKVLVL